MSEYYDRHNRLASACPVSNMSPVFGPSIKREIGIRVQSDHLATRETASYILFSAKNSDTSTKHTQSRTEKSSCLFSLCLLI